MADAPYFLIGVLTFAALVIVWLLLRNIVWYMAHKAEKRQRVIEVTGSILCALIMIGLVPVTILHWSHLLMFAKNTGTPVFRDEAASSIQVNRNDEIPSPDNDFTSSHLSTYYIGLDANYIDAVTKAITSCPSTGRWSAVRNDFTLYESERLLKAAGKDPGPYWQILWNGITEDGSGRYTFFYLYEDEVLGWLLDEPNYGIYHANEELVDLVQHYAEYAEIDPGVIYRFEKIFEYDPKRIWPNELYEDGRFDTYKYLTLKDSVSGEDVTESFIETWKPAYEQKDWETLITALQSVQESWQSEYVHPEDAHFEQ